MEEKPSGRLAPSIAAAMPTGPLGAARPATPAPALAGGAAAMVTVTIWAGWIIATRFAGESALGPIAIGLLRYGPPAVLLAPVWWRCGLLPRHCPWWIIALMVSGSGAPFLLVAAFAMRSAPAAQVGVLLPGTMPLWAALFGLLLGTSHFTKQQWFGYGLIGLGIAVMLSTGFTASGGAAQPAWVGQVLLLTAAACWAVYSHAFKRSGLTPLQGAAVVAAWSLLIDLLLAAIWGAGMAGIALPMLSLQLVVQGVLSGLIAIFSYGFAVASLGAAPAAAFSALAPVLATIGGALLLGEAPHGSDLVAIVAVTIGVVLASHIRLPAPRQQRQTPIG